MLLNPPNPDSHAQCAQSKPISESLGLKHRKLYYQKSSPTRRQGTFPKSALPNQPERQVYTLLAKECGN